MRNSKGFRVGFALGALFLLLLGAASIKAASGNAALSPSAGQPLTRTAERSDVSLPLRDMPTKPATPRRAEDNDNSSLPRPGVRHDGVDTAIQRIMGPLVMPAPIQNFDGIYNENGPVPPDTNGDVGRRNYVQIVNSQFRIFDKTGGSLYGPANNNTLFTGFGGICETHNDGDPVALYDSITDRWIMTWFAFTSQNGPTHQCFAISVTPDPLGSYYRYDFVVGSGFEDYPHLTLWPDAYYMSTNTFNDGANTAGLFAFNRAKIVRGDPTAQVIIFHLQGDVGMLSTNFEGSTLPPAGSPNYFFEWYNTSPGQLAEFKLHADFATPANSTLTGPFLIPVANFVWPVCGATRERCVPQPGTTAALETIGDRLMYRIEYRNFGGYESIVLNHTVNASSVAAPRWYELRTPNGASGATVFQQGTFAPGDGLHRWMGSIAQDRNADIAMGYSVSSSTVFPSIRYAGRIPTDPLGTFGQGEATLLAGTGSEDFPAAPRWGDYSSMSIDPTDDCTFWYTQEYFSVTGLRDWRTRVGSFKFPGCTAQGTPTPVASPTAVPPTNTPVHPVPTLCSGNVVATGSIATTDPTQTGRLGLGDPKSSCLVPKAVAAVSDMLTRHYDSYTYTNSTGSPQCVTVSIVQNCGNNAIQSVTYLGSFNPASVQTNYLADGGASGHSFSYSFSLAAGQTAVVVVAEVSPNLGCSSYSITINPCGPQATSTPVVTPSPTGTVVCDNTTYQTFASSGATLAPATNDTNIHCDDCVGVVNLPFPVTVYGTPYTSANVGSNGYVEFVGNNPNIYTQRCLPVRTGATSFFLSTLFAYYDDLRTDITPTVHGIYTDVIGTAPYRQFVLEWHATYFANDALEANFEVVMNESSPVISVIYGSTATEAEGASASSGIERDGGQYTAYSCYTDIPAGTRVDYRPADCGPPSCPIQFSDVPSGSTFYPYIRCLACRGIVNGYADGTFRPNSNVTRGQLSKIVSNSADFNDPQPTQMFQDVLVGSTFQVYIGRLASRGYINGYSCGGAGEPCVPPGSLPYFRPNNNATRGQIAKIDANAAGFADAPSGQSFEDVPPGSTFYTYTQRLTARSIMQGYNCGSLGEPCIPPGNRPYFRPNNNATRGQTSKIVGNTFFPGCQTPSDIRR